MSDIKMRLRTGHANGSLALGLSLKRRFRDLDRVDLDDDVCVQGLLALFFVEQDTVRIERLLSIISPGLCWCVRFDERLGYHPLVCGWRSSREEVTFTFGRFTFERFCDNSIRRWRGMMTFFQHVAAAGGFLGNIDLNLSDLGICPGACFCDNRDMFVLIPDMSFVESRGYDAFRQHFAVTRSWAERSSTAFWRGSTTGHSPVSALSENPRAALCMLARDNPLADMNFGLSGIVQFSSAWAQATLDAGLLKAFEPWQSLDQYKFHVDIDGNTNSWPGLFSKLLCGGLVLKVRSSFAYKQWYYNRLKPWVHYVPVESDLSDLIDTLIFLRENDAVAERIARQGREFALGMTLETELDRGAEALFAYSVTRARHST